jgi:putative heme-binding domain-containing protein
LFGKPTERTKVVAEFLSQIPAPVKTEQGEKLFGEHCAACHRPGEGKPMLGPPLENLGHWTLDQWVTAILDPNQAVEPKYRQSTLLTSDGQVIAGIVLDENPQETQIALSDGSLKTIPNEDIESLKSSAVSLMPEGFEQKLTPEQLSELLGFLRSR